LPLGVREVRVIVAIPQKVAVLPTGMTIDAMPDQQRFLAVVPEQVGIGSITVVQNWRAAIGKTR
jgi:hypothetical protein